MSSDSDRSLVPRSPKTEGEQGELFPGELLQQLIAVERERIDSANRRTDVAKMAIESNDAADKRQYEYHMARLRSSNDDKMRRHGLASKLFLGGGIFSACVLVFLLGMTFFGTEAQSELSLQVLLVLAIALGGYGVVAGVLKAANRLLNQDTK